jgi:hypothetical protein
VALSQHSHHALQHVRFAPPSPLSQKAKGGRLCAAICLALRQAHLGLEHCRSAAAGIPTRRQQNQHTQHLLHHAEPPQTERVDKTHQLPWLQVQAQPAAPGNREALRQRRHTLAHHPVRAVRGAPALAKPAWVSTARELFRLEGHRRTASLNLRDTDSASLKQRVRRTVCTAAHLTMAHGWVGTRQQRRASNRPAYHDQQEREVDFQSCTQRTTHSNPELDVKSISDHQGLAHSTAAAAHTPISSREVMEN